MKRIGIFGGNFDPVHTGHTYIALKAMKALNLEHILFVPVGYAHYKHTVTAPEIRFELLNLGLEQYKKFSINTYEYDQKIFVPTLSSMQFFEQQYVQYDLYYIFGYDSFLTFSTWCTLSKLINNRKFIICQRPCHDINTALEHQIKKYAQEVHFLSTCSSISSTGIRNMLNAGIVPQHNLHEKVAHRIQQKKYYYSLAP